MLRAALTQPDFSVIQAVVDTERLVLSDEQSDARVTAIFTHAALPESLGAVSVPLWTAFIAYERSQGRHAQAGKLRWRALKSLPAALHSEFAAAEAEAGLGAATRAC